MEASELRIGNYFYQKIRPGRCAPDELVIRQVKSWADGNYVNYSHLHTSVLDCEDIEPVPISPEILESCGFEKYGSYPIYKKRKAKKEGYHLQYEGLTISDVNEDGQEFWTWATQGIDLKYLHQLQNLYFALTGTELEVKLPVTA